MKRIKYGLALLFVLLFFVFPACAQQSFDYKGYVQVAPDLKARMTLKISGTDVTGVLDAPPVCGQNVRLSGAYAKFEGTLNAASWEAAGATITGSWKGDVLWCEGKEARQGSFTISMTREADYVLAFFDKLYYKRYVFAPAGKT